MSASTVDQGRAWNLIFAAWVLAMLASLGSLFFSEVMQRAPCVLCWYQRVAMFPLALVLGLALFPLDTGCLRYARALAAAGWLFAGYHCLIYLGIVPESLQPCSQGVSCAAVDIELAGFVTIPLLSLLAFSLIFGLLSAVPKDSTT